MNGICSNCGDPLGRANFGKDGTISVCIGTCLELAEAAAAKVEAELAARRAAKMKERQ